ncbi:MAG: serine hydroxymethyltransferase, partial [Desulfosarcinaceae bacterium]
KFYNFIHYGVDRETGRIDYEVLARQAEAERPRLIVAGASAYPRVIDFEAFGEIARAIGAYFMVDMAHIAGLVATGAHPSPFPQADVVTSTTHKTLRGPRGGLILAKGALAGKLRSVIFPGIQGGPLMHTIAAKAVAFKEAENAHFRRYQEQTVANAKALANVLLAEGVALVSGGTDNHMMLADLSPLNITGRDAETALGQAGMTVNKNAVPFDTRGPSVTSGIRIGTPFVTSRGMGTAEMERIGQLMVATLRRPDDAAAIQATRQAVREMCARFPLYPEH